MPKTEVLESAGGKRQPGAERDSVPLLSLLCRGDPLSWFASALSSRASLGNTVFTHWGCGTQFIWGAWIREPAVALQPRKGLPALFHWEFLCPGETEPCREPLVPYHLLWWRTLLWKAVFLEGFCRYRGQCGEGRPAAASGRGQLPVTSCHAEGTAIQSSPSCSWSWPGAGGSQQLCCTAVRVLSASHQGSCP